MDASRFDAFARSVAGQSSRRRLLRVVGVIGLAGALGRISGRNAVAKVKSCPAIKCPDCQLCHVDENPPSCVCVCQKCSSGGITGGGTIRIEGGSEAHLSLIATRTADPAKEGAFFVHGQLSWVDSTWEGVGLSLVSTSVFNYAPMASPEGGREASGWLTTDQRPGDYPFVLRAVDIGPPGSGTDTVALWVGDAVQDDAVVDIFGPDMELSGFRYAAEGTLTAGDLQLLSFADASQQSTPTA